MDFTDILTICGGTKVSNKLSLLWTEGPKHSLGWYFHFVKITILEIKQDESPARGWTKLEFPEDCIQAAFHLAV